MSGNCSCPVLDPVFAQRFDHSNDAAEHGSGGSGDYSLAARKHRCSRSSAARQTKESGSPHTSLIGFRRCHLPRERPVKDPSAGGPITSVSRPLLLSGGVYVGEGDAVLAIVRELRQVQIAASLEL